MSRICEAKQAPIALAHPTKLKVSFSTQYIYRSGLCERYTSMSVQPAVRTAGYTLQPRHIVVCPVGADAVASYVAAGVVARRPTADAVAGVNSVYSNSVARRAWMLVEITCVLHAACRTYSIAPGHAGQQCWRACWLLYWNDPCMIQLALSFGAGKRAYMMVL